VHVDEIGIADDPYLVSRCIRRHPEPPKSAVRSADPGRGSSGRFGIVSGVVVFRGVDGVVRLGCCAALPAGAGAGASSSSRGPPRSCTLEPTLLATAAHFSSGIRVGSRESTFSRTWDSVRSCTWITMTEMFGGTRHGGRSLHVGQTPKSSRDRRRLHSVRGCPSSVRQRSRNDARRREDAPRGGGSKPLVHKGYRGIAQDAANQ
jgi:hypothetical protein